jgi:hypothetical protein
MSVISEINAALARRKALRTVKARIDRDAAAARRVAELQVARKAFGGEA